MLYLAVILAVINVNIISKKNGGNTTIFRSPKLTSKWRVILNTKYNFITKYGFRKFFKQNFK